MKNLLKLNLLILITLIAILIAISFTVKSLAQNSLHLHLPFNGIFRINSYVDHQTPNDRNTITDTIIIFNGQEYNNCPGSSEQWTSQGPYCYDGHEGIDWVMMKNNLVLTTTHDNITK